MQHLKRQIGVPGAVFILVGYVIGASIFILPGRLAAQTGPGLFIAYLLAAIPALFNCVLTAQIGNVFPVSGANYVAVSTVLSPFLGFLWMWMGMIALAVGTPLLAYGFADYMAYFLPGLPPMLTAILVIVLVAVVNLVGVRLNVGIQSTLVVVFLLSLLIFGMGGVLYADWNLMVPLFPNGFEPILVAAVPAFYSYFGFIAIVSLGEEIKNPARTIPMSLGIGLITVVFFNTLVTLVLPALTPWQDLGTTEAPLAQASEVFLPKWFAGVLSTSALFAAATSINGIFLTYSRGLLAMARDRILPVGLTRLSRRFGEPDRAHLFIAGLAVLGVVLQASLAEYATMTVVGFMVSGILVAWAVLLLPQKLPQHFAKSPLKLGRFALWFFCLGKIALGLVFGVVGVMASPRPTLLFLVLLAVGGVYYRVRKGVLKRQGLNLDTLLHESANRVLEMGG